MATSLVLKHQQEAFSKTILGFWIYLMTDAILFCTLFATYGILYNSTFGGPGTHDIYDLSLALGETFTLLFSSLTSGLGLLAAAKNKKGQLLAWFGITFLLGLAFILMEGYEFSHLIKHGNDWTKSAFLSSYFTLVGTHGLHVSIGLLWLFVMILQVSFKGLTMDVCRRLVCFNMFWHFLDLVWIFIFTFVYLIGVM